MESRPNFSAPKVTTKDLAPVDNGLTPARDLLPRRPPNLGPPNPRLSVISVQLTWWIFGLPLLFKSTTRGSRVRVFFSTISWACVRIHNPSSAAIIAARHGRPVGHLARIYYLGGWFDAMGNPPEWTAWKYCTCIATEMVSIIATIITIYQACTVPASDPQMFGVNL